MSFATTLKRYSPAMASGMAGIGYLIYSLTRGETEDGDSGPQLPTLQGASSSSTLLNSDMVATAPKSRRDPTFKLQDFSKMDDEQRDQYYDDLFTYILLFDRYDEKEYVKEFLEKLEKNETNKSIFKEIKKVKRKIKKTNEEIYTIKGVLNVP